MDVNNSSPTPLCAPFVTWLLRWLCSVLVGTRLVEAAGAEAARDLALRRRGSETQFARREIILDHHHHRHHHHHTLERNYSKSSS